MLRGYDGRITGAASGLGRALAQELASRKCHLALIDVDAHLVVKTVQELKRPGARVSSHCADVGSKHATDLVAADVACAHGAARLLVNNAAVSASAGFAKTSSEASSSESCR